MADPEAPPPAPPAPKKHGCFFYGCITSLVLLAVAVLGIFLTVRFVAKLARQFVADYTDTTPMTLPKSNMPADQLKALMARVDAFEQAVDAHSNTPPLTLTGPEANAVLAESPGFAPFKDKFYVTFDRDETKAQISLPLDQLPPMPMVDVKGRYLNGTGTFKVEITNGQLSVVVDSLVAKGKPLPPRMMAGLQKRNLADGFNQGPNAASLQKYESVQVTNGVLIVTPKGP